MGRGEVSWEAASAHRSPCIAMRPPRHGRARRGGGDRREDADPLDTIRKQTIDQVLSELGSSRGGLASEEAGSRQQTAGKNLIESAKKRSPLLAFLSNFTHLMAVLLWVAGAIAFFAGMPELGVAVWLVNIINGVL